MAAATGRSDAPRRPAHAAPLHRLQGRRDLRRHHGL